MKLVVDDAERHKCAHIAKIFHGKSESISCTSLWVKTGAPGPKVRAGNPVTGSITIFVSDEFAFCAVSKQYSRPRLLGRGDHPPAVQASAECHSAAPPVLWLKSWSP